MRSDFVVREVRTGLRRNVTMTIAMVLTTAISLALVGTGLLAVRTIDRTEELYSDRVEVQVALSPGRVGHRRRLQPADLPGLRADPGGLAAGGGRCGSRASSRPTSATSSCSPGQSLADVVRPQSLPATLRVKLADQDGRRRRRASRR